MSEFFHSVTLDKDKCKGCINCIKRCPTKAIRVRNGKAHIIDELCIDCGECIRICPHHAKKAITDPLSVIQECKHPIALVPPSIYGQFNNLDDPSIVYAALRSMGFKDVFDVGQAAELVSDATRKMMFDDDSLPRPVISSACPAVVRLVRVRFPELVDRVLPVMAPVELAALLAREKALAEGIKDEDIGCIFLTPCPAKMTAIQTPIGIENSGIQAAIALNEIFPAMLSHMSEDVEHEPPKSGKIGLGWGESGGEAAGLIKTESYLAADGIENVIKVLEDIEDERYSDLEFVELNACPGGCVGGVLQVENPYIAKAKIKKLGATLQTNLNQLEGDVPSVMQWSSSLEYTPVMELGRTTEESFERYAELEEILSKLPDLDCGSCGAPTCRTFAEDVVRGNATLDECVVLLRRRMEAILNAIGLD